MFRWLEQLLSSKSTPPVAERTLDDLVESIIFALASDSLVGRRDIPGWRANLDQACARGALTERLPELRAAFDGFYQRHPLELRWDRGYNLQVVDPLALDADALARAIDPPALVPWAKLLRTLAISTGGRLFHHGCGLADLLDLLDDPGAPETLTNLVLPSVIVEDSQEQDRFVEALCSNPRLGSLAHLSFGSGMMLEPRHVERLAHAPWAGSLRSLDFCEQMVDWSVDYEPAQWHPALRAMGKFKSLTHLSMYNNLGDTADAAALLATGFPELVQLNLGARPDTAEFLDFISTSPALPKLRELCLAGGPPRSDPVWDRVVESGAPIYLHGTRVTATYPKRK